MADSDRWQLGYEGWGAWVDVWIQEDSQKIPIELWGWESMCSGSEILHSDRCWWNNPIIRPVKGVAVERRGCGYYIWKYWEAARLWYYLIFHVP